MLNTKNNELEAEVRRLKNECELREKELKESRSTQSQSQAYSAYGGVPTGLSGIPGITNVTSNVERLSDSVRSSSSRNSGTG